jgi:DNA polymerase III delta subunit
MLSFFSGTDRERVRAALTRALEAHIQKGKAVVRVTDAHLLTDVHAALQGGGMFAAPRAVVFENVLTHDETAPLLFGALESLSKSEDSFFILEEKVDAATRKRIEKYATVSERFDAQKKERDSQVFDLANALQRGDRKQLWVSYMREVAKGTAPEMIHGVLFWAAKQHALRSSGEVRSKTLQRVQLLAALPHQARRQGYDLEYALEQFVLSVA